MVGTGKLSRVLWCKFRDIWFLVHLTINIFILDFELLQAKCNFFQKRNHLVPFGYCHYVIKYLKSDMMNYYCLRVFRSRVRSIGKHSPGFLCSELECMAAVPTLSCAMFRSRSQSGRFFFLPISISHARQVIQ